MRAGFVLRARLFASLLVAREESGAKKEANAAAHLQPAGLWCRLCRAWGQQQSLPRTITGFHSCSSGLPVTSAKGKPACHCGLLHIPAWPCQCPGSAHVHRLGNQGGTLCCDPGLTPKLHCLLCLSEAGSLTSVCARAKWHQVTPQAGRPLLGTC